MTRFSRSTAILSALIASAVAAPAALAADEGTVVSAVRDRQVAYVRYSDLNLTNERGLAHLRTRVRSASRAVCNVDKSFTLPERVEAQSCRRQAIADAEVQIARIMAAGPAALASGGTISVTAD